MRIEGQEFPGFATVPLTATVSPDTTVVVVQLSGELDLAAENALDTVADRVLATAPGNVRLDLTDVTFCDARGLAAILSVRARLAAHQRQLTVTGAPPAVRRLLSITGLSRHLGVV
jgi:anti-sigma B factor antagonist